MSKNRRARRFIVASLAVLVISAFSYAMPWSSFGLFEPSQAAAPEAAAFLPPDTRTVCSTGTPDFATVALAVADANAAVPAGGRTYLVCAGHTETAPPTGIVLTAAGSDASNPVSFVKDGVGTNPTINAGVGTATPGSAAPDGIFSIRGADYITIDGFTFTDGNGANPATMEFGIGLFKAAAGNGANNNTIQNCTINMQRINNATATAPMIDGSVGILVINSTATAATTALTPTNGGTLATNGTNSANRFYANTINGGNYGIGLSGFAAVTGVGPAPTATTFLGDLGNDVGGAALATGNTILNFGGGAATNPSAGIRANNQWSVNLSYNTINNNNGAGVNHATTFRGIYAQAGTSASATINNNTITIQSGATTSTVSAIENVIGSTAASNTVSINSNIIKVAYTTATTGALNGILNSSTAATVNINSNDIQGVPSTSLAGTGSMIMISAGSSGGTLNTNSNTISNFSRSTTTSGTFRGIVAVTPPTVWNCTSNTIDGLSFTNAASTGSIEAIYNLSSATVQNVNSNIIRNLSTPTTGTITGIRLNTVTGTHQANNNQIYNFTTTAGGAGGATLIGINSSNGVFTASGNVIYSLNSSGSTGGTAGTIYGIQITGTTQTLSGNAIYDLSSTSTNPLVAGINVTGGTTNNLSNNLIGDLRAISSTGNVSISGIAVSGGTTNNIFHNTVNIASTTTSASTFGTSAIYFNGATPVNNLRNNILVNTSSPGPTGGFTAAIRYQTVPTSTNFPAANNNNFYYAGSAAANRVIYGEGSAGAAGNGQLTIAGYKTYISVTLPVAGRESASVSEVPNFVSTTGSNPITNFLKYDTGIATQIEQGGGTGTGISTDYAGTTRCPGGGCPGGAVTPDIGAWELSGTLLDLTAPSISYTALAGTASTANRNLTATITDPSGVAGAALAPRIYFKKSTDAGYVSTQCTGTYTCLIDYTMVGGGSVTTGDVIQYFVVAQDVPGNLGANPSGGFAGTNVNSVTTPPTTPNQYTIVAAITGTKTVCASGCDYSTLTGATGIFNAINTQVVTGNINIEINGDLIVGEDGSVALNPLTEEPAGSNFTVKIYPTGAARAITSTTAPAGGFIRLNAADRVTIDGSIGGTGTDRSLTVTTANAGTTSAVVWLQSNGTDGAQNNTVKNLNVVGNSNTTTLIGIGMGATGTSSVSTTSLGTNNNTNTIQNNNISKTQYGIYSQGASSATKNTGNVITQNLMNTATPNHVARGGIQVGFENNIQITQNTIDGITLASSPDVFGIALGLTGISTTSFTGNEVTNATVSRNFIGKVTNTGTFSAVGISVASATSGTNAITNNSIYGVGANGTGGDFGAGIFLGGGTGSTTQVYFNSVSMTGTFTGGSFPNYGLAIGGSDPTVDVRNNVFFNTLTNGTGVSFAIGTASSTFANLTSNYNDHFVTTGGGTFKIGKTGSLSQGTGTEHTLLSDWTTATGKDTPNSISANPSFNSTTNLQPQIGSPLVGAGTPVSVLTDILGVTRSVTTPTIGAYENAIDTAGPVITYTPFGNTTSTLIRTLNVTVTDSSGVPTAGVGLPVIYYRKNAGAWASTQCSFVSGSSYTCDIVPAAVGGVMISDVIQYYVAAQDNIGNVSVNPSAGASGFTTNPPAAATPPTTPNTYAIVGSATGTYQVGTGQTYTSLTNAGGIFEFINNSEVTGDVDIEITSDLAGELGTVALNQFTAGFNVRIFSCSAPRLVTGTNAGALIRLNGADNVTIEGNPNTCGGAAVGGNPALRGLTITNTNTGTSSAVIGLISLGAGAGSMNNTVQNLNLVGTTLTATNGTLFGIYSGGATISNSSNGPDNDNNTFRNNNITKSQYGIYSAGESAANKNTGTVISENQMNAPSPNNLNTGGIYLRFDSGAMIDQNDIAVIRHDGTAGLTGTAFGIALGLVPSGTTTVFTGSDVTGATLTRNKINGVTQLQSTGWSAFGIVVNTVTSGSTTLHNNMISGVRAASTPSDFSAGIVAGGGVGSSTVIFHNSVAMTGTRGAATFPSYGLAVGGNSTIMQVANNIFYNTQSSTSTGKMYAIGWVASVLPANIASDSNDFYVNGASTFVGQTGGLGTAGTDQLTLANWQAASTEDGSSQDVDPVFVNPATDLHLDVNGTAPDSPLIGDGLSLGVTIDHDDDPRPATAPEIGADELVQSDGMGSFPAGTFYNAIAAPNDQLAGSVDITNSITLNGILNTGNFNTLTLGCNASFANAGGGNYVVGTVNKQYCATGSFVYPVGTTPDNVLTESRGAGNGLGSFPEYTPVIVNVTGGTFPSYLSARVFDATLTGFDPLNSLSRNWELEELGDITADLSFTYLDGVPTDVNGTEANYIVYRRNANGTTDPMCLGPCVDTGLNVLGPVTGVTQFSRWTGAALAPTAAAVDVSGRILTPEGAGLRNAIVTLTDSRGVVSSVRSSSFGNYRFEGVRVGETYILGVNSKRYVFTPRVVQVLAEVTGLDVTADGEQ